MKLTFNKYHGTGNDFILIDNRKEIFAGNKELIKHLCDRRFGIGADGLIILNKSESIPLKMTYYNSDGNESTMCGNGGRCFVAFAKRLGMITKSTYFEAIDGTHQASIIQEEKIDRKQTVMNVKLGMKNVQGIEQDKDYIFMDTGSPHYVIRVEDVSKTDVITEGRKIRYNDRFKDKGTNVNFIQVKDDSLYVRTYERGVEDETFSCGTGVTAAALAADYWNLFNTKGLYKISTPGGELKVHYKRVGNNFENVFLEGAATFVFEGEIEI
jgi:diaminopimelate epimerase